MAERFKALVLKTSKVERLSGVRISSFPPVPSGISSKVRFGKIDLVNSPPFTMHREMGDFLLVDFFAWLWYTCLVLLEVL